MRGSGRMSTPPAILGVDVDGDRAVGALAALVAVRLADHLLQGDGVPLDGVADLFGAALLDALAAEPLTTAVGVGPGRVLDPLVEADVLLVLEGQALLGAGGHGVSSR